MEPYVAPSRIEDKVELIFVNDGSSNDSLSTLLRCQEDYSFVQVLDLSRNFGQHAAIACGLREAKGKYVIRMNVDGQDPPSELPKLIDIAQNEDADLVVGKYQTRMSPLRNRLTAFVYYYTFKLLTGFDTPTNTSALRVMSYRFVGAYNQLVERDRFPQGLDHWLGFKHRYVEITHRQRADNRSSYTFRGRLLLALNGVLYFSDRPIKLVVSSGFFLASIGILLALFLTVQALVGADLMPGFASLASIALIAFGTQLFVMGLLGLYIAKIFQEVQGRPLFIIRDRYAARQSSAPQEVTNG